MAGKLIEIGLFAEFIAAVARQLPRSLDPQVVQRWIDDQGALHTALGSALREGPPLPVDPDAWVDTFDLAKIERRVFKVTVDPKLTIEQLVQAGEYNYKHPAHTTAVFGPCRMVTGTKSVKAKVVAFRIGRNATREQAKRLRARLKFGAICIQHELALGAQHKRAQQELNQIVNPDDVVWVGVLCGVSYLDGRPDGRRLGLSGAVCGWDSDAWFLGLLREPA